MSRSGCKSQMSGRVGRPPGRGRGSKMREEIGCFGMKVGM